MGLQGSISVVVVSQLSTGAEGGETDLCASSCSRGSWWSSLTSAGCGEDSDEAKTAAALDDGLESALLSAFGDDAT